MSQKYGKFSWGCPHCLYTIVKDTPQGLGLAKSNHLRKHTVPVDHHVEYIPRNFEEYPEGLCGEMEGNCMNCPLPENMRGECIQAHGEYRGYHL